jgi:ADP-ribose pyrophosphatase
MSSLSDATHPATVTIGDGRFLRLVRRGKWEYVERLGARGAAAIVAVTDDGRLVLIEQPRPALGGVAVELPAGLVGDTPGDESEEAATAANRELVEETGYEASRIEQVAHGPSSPGLTSECISIFVATGLRKVGPGGGDGNEQITVFEVPLAEVEAWLGERIARGAHVDLKVYAGLYFARQLARHK